MSASSGRDADSFYVEDCRTVQNNTHAIQTATGAISRLVGSLEAHDVERCRRMVDEAVQQASETRTVLMRIKQHQHQAQSQAEKNSRSMMYKKLSDNLSITARVLEDVVRRFSVEEGKHLASGAFSGSFSNASHVAVFSATAAGDVAAGDDGDDDQSFAGAGLGFGGRGSRNQAAPDFLQQELQKERVDAVQRVEEDMRCLQSIYSDLAAAADSQQANFDTLESHMAQAAGDLELGNHELEIARQSYSRTLKQRMLVGAATVAGFFLVSTMVFGS